MLLPRLTFHEGNKELIPLNSLQRKVRDRINKKVIQGKFYFEEVPCDVCKGNKFEQVSTRDRYGLYVPVAICTQCGLVQTNPRMTKKSYDEFYENDYAELYMGTTQNRREHFLWQSQHGREIEPFLNNKKSLTIVEIGCGAGGILHYFKSKGHTVVGFELDKQEVAYGNAQGLDIRHGSLAKFQGKADLIIYSHVLEHILDPVKEFKLIKSKLKKDGLVYIEVPGVENVESFFGADLGRYFQNAHVYHFTKQSLSNVAASAGFTNIIIDSFIHSVWRPGRPGKIVNDYPNAKRELLRLERERKNIFNIPVMKTKIFRTIMYMLRATKLDIPLKKLYFRFVKKGKYRVAI